MPKARVFKSGRDPAVELSDNQPSGMQVEISRRNNESVLPENQGGLSAVLDLFAQLPPEVEQRDDLPPDNQPVY